MPLSWNEIKSRAFAFSKEWRDEAAKAVPLVKPHQQLDNTTDLCYRPQPFPNETKRIEFLFELYDKYTSRMFKEEKKK